MKALFQIRKKENEPELVLNPSVFSEVDVIDLDFGEYLTLSLKIKVRKRCETIYDDTLTRMLEDTGLAHHWNVEVRFLWIDLHDKTVLLHLHIPKLLDNLDRELLGLPLE